MATNPNEVLPQDEGAETFPVEPQTPITPDVTSASGDSPNSALTDAFNMPRMQAQSEATAQEGTRERATNWESVKAGANMWATKDIWKFIHRPSFEPSNFDVGAALLEVPFQLTDTEREFLLSNKSRSQEEHKYLLEQLLTERKGAEVFGDNPVFGFIAAALDPVWLGVGAASGGVGTAARFANLGWRTRALMSAGVEATAAVGINSMVGQVRPLSLQEMVVDAMLGGGIAIATTGRGGRGLRKLDPEFPSQEFNAFARSMNPENVSPAVNVTPKYDPDGQFIRNKDGSVIYETTADTRRKAESARAARVARETAEIPSVRMPRADNIPPVEGARLRVTARSAIESTISKISDPKARLFLQSLADRLGPALDDLHIHQVDKPVGSDKRGYYDPGRHEVVLHSRFEDDPWALSHEIMHGATWHKIRYGRMNPNSAHGRIVKDLEDVFNIARRKVQRSKNPAFYEKYFTKNLDEFMAGLWTGDKDFERLMRSIDMPDGRSALSRFVDKVRELLGIPHTETSAFIRALGLSEDLLREPLKIVFDSKGGKEIMQLPANPTRAQLVSEITRTNDLLWNSTKKMGSASGAAAAISWNFHKTLAKYNKRVAGILLDDPLQQAADSADSWARTIRAAFTRNQRTLEDTAMDILKSRGIRERHYLYAPERVMAAQKKLNMELMDELDYRASTFHSTGTAQKGGPGSSPEVVKLADEWEASTKAVLDEQKRSGVFGADEVVGHPGYFPRHWSSAKIGQLERRLEDAGLSPEDARSNLRDGLQEALQSRNPNWDPELSRDVATAILDRARRKGDFNDQTFRHHIGNEGLAVMRDEMTKAGLDPKRMQRVLDVFSGKVDEANKSSRLKSRVDIDGHFQIRLADGTTIKAHDMFETDLLNSMEHYMDEAAGQSAFARMGIKTESDFGKLHDELIRDVPTHDQPAYSQLFHDAVNLVHGRPVGKNFSSGVRFMQAAVQMLGLGSSGMWQLTEYAKLMQRYGIMKSLKHMRRSFRANSDIRNMTPEQAGRLEDILARNSFQDIRLRPMLQKLEDGFDLPTGSNVNVALHRAKQLVPYINAMKWVHHHQANLVGSLVTDTLAEAARGNAKSLDILKKYGIDLDSPLMGQVRRDIAQHGADTTRWADDSLDSIRTGLDRMMDDAVLRSRKGEMPAFAQVNDAGKFIFTFRSFVLGAHNKTLAGTMSRDGWAGLSLLLMYQYPMSLGAVQLNAWRNGQELSDDELVKRATAMMGGIGLFSELVGVLTGESREFGAPGLIAVDRGFGVLSAAGGVARGTSSAGDLAAATLNATPLLAILPFSKAFQETLKD